MASVKWKCCLPHSNSDGSAATYGNRCVSSPDGEYDTQEDCETFCLHPEWEVARIDDIYMTAHNVIQFVYDRGMKFPVPRGFLEKIATRQRNDFYQVMRLEDKYYNIVRHGTDNFQQIVLDVLGKTRKVATYKISILSSNDNYENMRVIRDIEKYIRNEEFDIFYIFLGVNRSGSDENHANSIIVDSKYKKIIRLEPHQKYYDDIGEIKNLFSKQLDEGYEYYENSVCPSGFQNRINTILGGACATWAEFMAIWVAMNPERDIREILDYATGSKSADSLLLLYIYYSKIRYPKVWMMDSGYTEIVILNNRLVTLIRDNQYNIDFIQDTLVQINKIISQIQQKIDNDQSIKTEESYFSAHVIDFLEKVSKYYGLLESGSPSMTQEFGMIYDCSCIFYGDYINMAPVLSSNNLRKLKLYYTFVPKQHDLQTNRHVIVIEPTLDRLVDLWIDFGSREARARVQRFLRRISQLYKEPGSTQQSVYQELLGCLNMDKQMRRKTGEK